MIEINKNYNESNLETLKRIPDNTIDLTVTSPPYDNLRMYNGYSFDFENVAKELYRVTKNGGVVVWVVGDATINGSETGASFKQALYFIECGFNLHDTMIYEKTGFSNPSSNRYHQTFEYMFVFSKGKPKTFNPIIDRKNKYKKRGGGSKRKVDGKMQSGKGGQTLGEFGKRFNVWRITHNKSQDRLHPASFPPTLANDHIISWSNENDLVYDCFMGSGTVAKMSILNNRNWIGSEISSEYCEIIKERVKKAWEEKRKEKDLQAQTLFGTQN